MKLQSYQALSMPGNVYHGVKYVVAQVLEGAVGDLGQTFDLPAPPREIGLPGEGGCSLP